MCLDEDVLNTSWSRLSSLSSEDIFKTFSKRLDQDQCIFLSHTSSRHPQGLSKKSLRHHGKKFSIHLQGLFKTSSKCLAYVFQKRLGDVLQKRFEDALQKRLWDIFKTSSWRFEKFFKEYHPDKLFLLTRLREVFSNFLSRTAKTVIYRGICLCHTSQKFMISLQNLKEIWRFLKF